MIKTNIVPFVKSSSAITVYNFNTNILNKDILNKVLNKVIFDYGNILFFLHYKNFFFVNVSSNNLLLTYNSIKGILALIYGIESKGFLNNTNLNNYPVISNFIIHLTNSDDYLSKDKASDSFKWIFNIILLSLHELIVKILIDMEASSTLNSNEEISDLNADFIILDKEILAKIDPSIRKKLQSRGITLTQNIYSGFDTEFKRINENKNLLLSVQLAINTKLLLRIPKYDSYVLSSIDPVTGKEYRIGKNNKLFKFNIIEKTINWSIDIIRSFKYKNDSILPQLIFELQMLNIHYVEKDDDFIFTFPRTNIQPFIYYGDNYTLEDIVNQINLIADPIIKKDTDDLFSTLVNIYKNLNKPKSDESAFIFDNLENDIVTLVPIISNVKPIISKTDSKNFIKKLTRSSMNSFTDNKISVTRVKNIYIIAHYSNVDLSMLKDFDTFKIFLNIVDKSYVKLGKPFLVNGNNVFIKDTILLSPQGKKSLAAIGDLYKGFNKIELTLDQIENMDLLLTENKELFQEYALMDAIITLIHANYMEDFFFDIKGNGVPNTLSKISAVYILDYWMKNNYNGYQISNEFLLSNTSATITPKGLWAISKDTNVGFKLNYYIASFKGGRNECFMFGVDKHTHWYDYDLASAYTTVMAFAGNPDYKNARKLSINQLNQMTNEELVFSYTIIECDFTFRDNVKFPSIPCFIDKSSTAYPLKGKAILTGLEYLLAKNQGCFITIKEAYTIPFESKLDKDNNKTFINRPFFDFINFCQNERRKHPKNSILNLIWKLIANALYGLTGQGLNEKMKFNIHTNSMMRMDAGVLSNPIIASWITAFIRTIIGESLHNIYKLKGKVVSVTTDGFITDIDKLESKLLDLKDKDIFFLKLYRGFREELSKDPTGLELKNDGKGIISWTTRGQISLNAGIKATTGFQANNYTLSELNDFFTYILSTDNKLFEYIQMTLTTPKTLFVKGGHVTPVYRDQTFRLHFDNKRIIVVPKHLENSYDFSNVLLDSLPVKDIQTCANLRNISKILKTKSYQKHSYLLSGNTYIKYIDLAIRNFIKAVLSNPPKFNLKPFDNYTDIINFIKEFDPTLNITKQKISNLKNRKIIFKSVPKIPETIKFTDFIYKKFHNFNVNEFFSANLKFNNKQANKQTNK